MKIRSLYEEAIENCSSLFLIGNCKISGVNYDILTENPVYLSGYEGVYSSAERLKVRCNSEFDNGYLNTNLS